MIGTRPALDRTRLKNSSTVVQGLGAVQTATDSPYDRGQLGRRSPALYHRSATCDRFVPTTLRTAHQMVAIRKGAYIGGHSVISTKRVPDWAFNARRSERRTRQDVNAELIERCLGVFAQDKSLDNPTTLPQTHALAMKQIAKNLIYNNNFCAGVRKQFRPERIPFSTKAEGIEWIRAKRERQRSLGHSLADLIRSMRPMTIKRLLPTLDQKLMAIVNSRNPP